MSDLLRYWAQALRQSRGVKIKVSDRTLLRQQLYRAREASEDKADYKGLAVVFPKVPKDELWIVHKEQDDV